MRKGQIRKEEEGMCERLRERERWKGSKMRKEEKVGGLMKRLG